MTPPPASIATTRSTSGRASATRCSTITSVRPSRSTTEATTSRIAAAPSGSRLAVGSSSSSRPGRRASDAGDRQSLLLAAGERVGRTIAPVAEAHRLQRGIHARPDRLGRQAAVLQAERHVVAGAGHDQLALRVLEDEPGCLTRPAGLAAVDGQAALRIAGARLQQPGQGQQQRGLAGPRGTDQQHPLPRLDAQVQAAQRPAPAAGMPPAPAARLDRDGCDGGRGSRQIRPPVAALSRTGRRPARRSAPAPAPAATSPGRR